jgi:RND family efflux transporter MFP subunit
MSTPDLAPPAPPAKHHLRLFVVLLLLAALAAWGIFNRINARASLRRETENAATLTVATVKPSRALDGDKLILPGTIVAQRDAPIYARTSGYLKHWYVDIGSSVKAGQVLAIIESPEVDQQLHQATADLANARANYALARSTAVRWKSLLATESVSQQDADEKNADAAAKLAQMQSAQANVARLRQLVDFERVTAPFTGTVTARNTDVGALINAGGSGGELFHVAATRRLRVYVQVPQVDADAIHVGMQAELHVSDRPGQKISARLVRSAKAIDPVQRTLLAELEVDNADGRLLAGSYAEVHLELPAADSGLRLPANTLIFRDAGLQVATLDADHRVRLKTIKLGRDFGNTVEVLQGLSTNDVVVANPPDSIVNGQQVRLVSSPQTGNAAATVH